MKPDWITRHPVTNGQFSPSGQEPPEPPIDPEAELEAAWQEYRAKSNSPDLLNYEDFCAGYGASKGGVEQFMRMKSRMTELEARIAQYERMLSSWPRPDTRGAASVNFTDPHRNIPLGISQHEFDAHIAAAKHIYSTVSRSEM